MMMVVAGGGHARRFRTEGSYYVLLGDHFEAREGCGPVVETSASPAFWNFTIQAKMRMCAQLYCTRKVQRLYFVQDFTPPRLHFTKRPHSGVVLSNISITWTSSEEHVDFCSLRRLLLTGDSTAASSSSSTPVDCPDSAWSSGDLEEGQYQLEVTTQDGKNNSAVWEANFVVDKTPPKVVFRHTPGSTDALYTTI